LVATPDSINNAIAFASLKSFCFTIDFIAKWHRHRERMSFRLVDLPRRCRRPDVTVLMDLERATFLIDAVPEPPTIDAIVVE
jgi:hypothetical protein